MDASLLHRFTQTLDQLAGFVTEHEALKAEHGEERSSNRLDALVRTRTPNGDICLLAIECKHVAYPRDARVTIDHLEHYRQMSLHDGHIALCVIAEEISPGSRQALREAGVNYFDQSGTLYFRHQTWLVDVERAPVRAMRKKELALFKGAREQVVHALLHHCHEYPGQAFISGAELSALAQTSTFTVSSTMQGLEQLDLVESRGTGPAQRRRVRDPAALLDAWAEEWSRRKEVRTRWYAFAPGGNIVDKVIDNFARHAQTPWALTGAAAANALVPRLTNVERAEVIVQAGEAEKLASLTGMSPAEKGSNVTMIERSGASLMFSDEHPQHPGSRIASRFIQYLDLLNGHGRNKELAEEFRRQALHMESSERT